jgi:hypothetical protein
MRGYKGADYTGKDYLTGIIFLWLFGNLGMRLVCSPHTNLKRTHHVEYLCAACDIHKRRCVLSVRLFI